MSFAFSANRNEAGGSFVTGGNPKAATFVGTAISKWNTSSATTLKDTFYGASEMNVDLSGWKVSKVTTLEGTFLSASKFVGTGLGTWITTSVKNLRATFKTTSKFVAAVSAKCVGGSYAANPYTADTNGRLCSSGWCVGGTITYGGKTFPISNPYMEDMQGHACRGNGVGIYTSPLGRYTHGSASKYLSTSKFEGTGLAKWSIAKVTTMDNTFYSAMSLTSCNKRLMADAWNGNSQFKLEVWKQNWAADACPPLTDATFKQASWGT